MSLLARSPQSFKKKSRKKFSYVLGELEDEQGSITPLAFGFLLITLILVFLSINLLHGFVERRHLILVTEAALQRASQNIDDRSYYTGYVERNTIYGGARMKATYIPIDCEAARNDFFREFQFEWMMSQISNSGDELNRPPRIGYFMRNSTEAVRQELELRGSVPRVQSFNCDGKTVRARVALDVYLPFPLVIGSINFKEFSTQEISIEVGSIWGG